MTECTLSVCSGKGCLRHNNRDFVAENIDKTRIKNNIFLLERKVEDVYTEVFGEALSKYNAKQKRQDRKISNYLKHLKRSGNKEKIFHEIIVTLGNKDCHPSQTECVDIYKKYFENFQKINTNCIPINAIVHLDEATPHMHIDFIMIKTNQKRGLEVQNSKRGALQQMGFTTTEEGYINWIYSNRDAIETMAKEKGITIVDGYASGEEKVNCKAYKKMARKNEQDIKSIPDINIVPETNFLGKETGNMIIRKQDVDEFQNAFKLAKTVTKGISEREEAYGQELVKIRETNETLNQTVSKLELERNKIEEDAAKKLAQKDRETEEKITVIVNDAKNKNNQLEVLLTRAAEDNNRRQQELLETRDKKNKLEAKLCWLQDKIEQLYNMIPKEIKVVRDFIFEQLFDEKQKEKNSQNKQEIAKPKPHKFVSSIKPRNDEMDFSR